MRIVPHDNSEREPGPSRIDRNRQDLVRWKPASQPCRVLPGGALWQDFVVRMPGAISITLLRIRKMLVSRPRLLQI